MRCWNRDFFFLHVFKTKAYLSLMLAAHFKKLQKSCVIFYRNWKQLVINYYINQQLLKVKPKTNTEWVSWLLLCHKMLFKTIIYKHKPQTSSPSVWDSFLTMHSLVSRWNGPPAHILNASIIWGCMMKAHGIHELHNLLLMH